MFLRRPISTATQLVILAFVLLALFFALDFNRREQAGKLAGSGLDELLVELDHELTRQPALMATRDHAISDRAVYDYVHSDGAMVKPGEIVVNPLIIEVTATPAAPSELPSDPASMARPWQVWWQLLSDSPMPKK